jgi:four helix bundle protein
VTYEEWERGVPAEIANDALWKVKAYRLALFVADIGWHDVTRLVQDRRTIGLADQLYRAVGSIGANMAEGYSRGSGRDRARFYEYALGSARESRDWYFKARHVLTGQVIVHRLDLLSQLVRLLVTMVPQQRGQHLSESGTTYSISTSASGTAPDDEVLASLLTDVPLA